MIEKISQEFLNQFIINLNKQYPVMVKFNNLIDCVGTNGWGFAFKETCEHFNNTELYNEYFNLSVDDSDNFDNLLYEKVTKILS